MITIDWTLILLATYWDYVSFLPLGQPVVVGLFELFRNYGPFFNLKGGGDWNWGRVKKDNKFDKNDKMGKTMSRRIKKTMGKRGDQGEKEERIDGRKINATHRK